MNGYELSRAWFDFSFEKKEANVYHTSIFSWCIELNNRLGWKKEFGLPTQATMEGLSIGNKNTYLSALKDLEIWGFIKVIAEAKNQYQSCIISLCRSDNDTALYTALDTALIQHDIRHEYSTVHDTVYATDTIDKQLNHKPKTKKQVQTLESYVEKNKEELAEVFKDYPTIKEHAYKWLKYKFKSEGYKETGWSKIMVKRIKETSLDFIKKQIDETIDNETGNKDYVYQNQIDAFKKTVPTVFTPTAQPKKQMTNEERLRA